jgi:imidazoleglycerol phosphate synthase glutamine amidotransferase subunit HisH
MVERLLPRGVLGYDRITSVIPMIAIIDYGASNLSSVVKAITHLGYRPVVTANSQEVARARVVVLPGVGAAGEAISRLGSLGLIETLMEGLSQCSTWHGETSSSSG